MTDEARPYFPMFVDISHKKVVVVGAGTIAKRRIRTLVDFTENLSVIAPRSQSGASGTPVSGKDPDPEKTVPERGHLRC